MNTPEGYKPVIHRVCGKQHSWVRAGVSKGMKIHAEDIMLLDGTVPGPQSAIPKCPSCGRIVTGQGLMFE